MEILLSIRSKSDGTVREVKRDIDNGLVIGRGAEEGLLLDGPDLSREHLVLTTDGAFVFVADLSSNGTWLNGNKLHRSLKTRVKQEDLIEIPGYVLTYRPASQPEVVAVPAAQEPVAPPSEKPSENLPLPVQPPVYSAYSSPVADQTPAKSGWFGPLGRFVGSFTFMEKFIVLVAIGGLVLVYTYMG